MVSVLRGVGSFLYAMDGGVDLSIVLPRLAGSALGARLGSGATSIVDEDGIKIYFGLMLLSGALAVAVREAGTALGIDILNMVSLVLILGSALLVSGAILYSSVAALREESSSRSSTAD